MVIGTRTGMGEDAFKAWGWRIPFLVSLVLLAVSLWIRMKLDESPVFSSMKRAGTTSKAPLSEAFGRWGNLKIVLIALLGAVMGQAVVWYTGQFYALFFLERILRVDGATTNILTAIALALATPGVHIFRLAVRPDRPQAHHSRRLPAGRAHLFAAVPCAHAAMRIRRCPRRRRRRR